MRRATWREAVPPLDEISIDLVIMSNLSRAWRNSRLHLRLVAKRFPRMLIIGAQKCGTSALFAYLAQHPRFEPAPFKELSFFGSDLRFAYGMGWYIRQWDRRAPTDSIRFEASPQYFVSERAPARIHQCLPNVKLIAVLRDPVERAYSAWQMYRSQVADDPEFYPRLVRTFYSPQEAATIEPRTTAELDDFWLAVQREVRVLEQGRSMDWPVVQLGIYAPQLQRYTDLFPSDRLLVLDSHDLRTDRVNTLNRTLHFLGQPNWDWSQANLDDVFVGVKPPPMPERARDFLREYYRESNRMLCNLLDEPPRFALEALPRRASA
jgi:hypothetical protein